MDSISINRHVSDGASHDLINQKNSHIDSELNLNDLNHRHQQYSESYWSESSNHKNEPEDPWITKGEIEIRFLDEESDQHQNDESIRHTVTNKKLWTKERSTSDEYLKKLSK